ncbi:spermidine hydroxycinnamoyl transferase-like [Neltuma alba]|uniref:spermidine hydroxycinnamoyl transferase-like n=1 Tax=Neltuma alba TaxID=207710 RepID=UPI0010A52CB3|nr:spermidine hydroxycinnamoyl transferase-like [Prosopis alba]XP_028793318.1 spermidine hydroxycinnamoyl transferase-like [Prosopis alba]
MAAIRLKGSHTVRPCDPTWIGTMALSEWDQIGCVTHVPAIYLYRSPNRSASAIAETLKDSLSKVLVPFYPLAGRLQWIGNGRLQLQCNAMGARFIEAECESSLNDIGDLFLSPQHRNLFPSADYGLPIHELPLFLVQLTTFRCGGVTIAIALSHAVADGPAALHFMSEWARITRGETLQTPPFHDRSVFRAGQPPLASSPRPTLDDFPEYGKPALLLGQSDTSEERKKKTTTAMLKITKAQVEKLRKMANDSREKPMARGFTRYETICGHVWRISCKARGHRKQQPTAMGIIIDSRSRMRPELPREFFGTATFDVIAQSMAGDLMSKPLGFAASKVRETIEKVTDNYVRSSIEFLKNQKDLKDFQDIHSLLRKEEGPFYGNPNITVVSWLTLPLYGFDFGWGKEQYMGPGPYEDDGNCLLMHSPEGDGSVVVAMCLQEAHMDEFKKLFYQDLL